VLFRSSPVVPTQGLWKPTTWPMIWLLTPCSAVTAATTMSRLVPATIEKYGGRFLVRGGAHEVIEGEWQPHRLVLLAFADMARAKAWYQSPEYAAAKAIRFRTSRGQLLIVDGV